MHIKDFTIAKKLRRTSRFKEVKALKNLHREVDLTMISFSLDQPWEHVLLWIWRRQKLGEVA